MFREVNTPSSKRLPIFKKDSVKAVMYEVMIDLMARSHDQTEDYRNGSLELGHTRWSELHSIYRLHTIARGCMHVITQSGQPRCRNRIFSELSLNASRQNSRGLLALPVRQTELFNTRGWKVRLNFKHLAS